MSQTDEAAAMAKMMEYATPGEYHQRLDALVGSWIVEGQLWPAPGAPPMQSKGTAEARWILDKRFVEEVFSTEMSGHPVTGHMLTGFDNAKQKFISVWGDTMSTGLVISEGAPDPALNGFWTKGLTYQAMTGAYIPTRFVTRIEGPKAHIVEMHQEIGGTEVKTMQIVYKRK